MNEEIYKKIVFFISMFVVLGFIITPTTNAGNTKIADDINYNLCLKNVNINNNNFYDLLIITPMAFYSSLKPLVRHKNENGISTKIVTLDTVYNEEFWGRDNAEKIKYFIKEAVENWGIKYVLLVGGMKGQSKTWYLPVRYVSMGNSYEPHIISDLYYADIYDEYGNFSSWDSNDDGEFSEWFKDDQPKDVNIDLYPDVAVGRIPCRNKKEVKIMVKKIIKYETKTNYKSWFYDMLVIAGDTHPEIKNPKWVGYEGEYYGDRAIENMTSFNPTKLYTSDQSLTHWTDIVKAFKNGYGFVYFVGHGSPMSWSNHLPNNQKRIESFTVFHIPLLLNGDKLPICIISGCHNCQFDVNIFNIFDKIKKDRAEYPHECMGWWMTKKIMGGSIATLGCTALGFTKEDKDTFKGGINELEVEFFRQYGQNNIEILGDVWSEAITWYTSTYHIDWSKELNKDSWIDAQVVQTWILFGDPSLKIGGYPQ